LLESCLATSEGRRGHASSNNIYSDIKWKLFEYLDFHSDLNVKIFIELNLLWTEHIWERDCFTIKMNWFMRKKSLKPSLMNLIKPLLKCRVTKCSETENFTQLLMSLYSVILIFKTGMTKFSSSRHCPHYVCCVPIVPT